jgi:hypothetical protein
VLPAGTHLVLLSIGGDIHRDLPWLTCGGAQRQQQSANNASQAQWYNRTGYSYPQQSTPHYSMSDQPIPELDPNLLARLEALLFVAPGAVATTQLAAALDLPLRDIEQGLAAIEILLNRPEMPRGLRLQRHHGRVQLTSAPEMAGLVERFLGLEASSRLSRAALETLSIVAYQQPVTRPRSMPFAA